MENLAHLRSSVSESAAAVSVNIWDAFFCDHNSPQPDVQMFFLLYYIYKRAQLGAANLLGIKEAKTETEKSELAITKSCGSNLPPIYWFKGVGVGLR